jgi:hypothetical protein
MTAHPVRRLETHKPQHSSLACHSKVKAMVAVRRKAKRSKRILCRLVNWNMFTPLECPSIPACRNTGMLGMVEIHAKAGASASY